jgi:hypothetical protein
LLPAFHLHGSGHSTLDRAASGASFSEIAISLRKSTEGFRKFEDVSGENGGMLGIDEYRATKS